MAFCIQPHVGAKAPECMVLLPPPKGGGYKETFLQYRGDAFEFDWGFSACYSAITNTTSSCSTSDPSLNTISFTVPALAATTVDSIFIASMAKRGMFFSI